MISRYKPTYSYLNLIKSYFRSYHQEISTNLVTALKRMYNIKHVFLFGEGKIAITVLLKAYNNPGSVLTSAYNCIAVPQAIAKAGYSPLFVDASPASLNVSIDDFIDAITPQVKVLMPVHLFGIPWRIDQLLEKNLNHDFLIVEDVAPAFGARLNGRLMGSFSDAFIISFHWTKPLSGETGGAILTNDDHLAQNIQTEVSNSRVPNNRIFLFTKTWLRKIATERGVYSLTRFAHSLLHGEDMYEIVPIEKSDHSNRFEGMSPFACALVLEQLGRLDWILSRRRELAEIYQEKLSDLENIIQPSFPENSQPSWIQYPILVKNKLSFYKYMQRHGVDVTWSYRYSCPDTYGKKNFPNSMNIAKSIIGLPTYPALKDEDVEKISSITREFFMNEV